MFKRSFKVIQSLLAALVGVQSERKRREDFENGKFFDFLIGAVFMTIAILVFTYFIVIYVIGSMGVDQ